ncbi:hypothetical protein [Myxococcus xanthus]|nr:hypothetical protein [Myxococcus xanthus]
MNQERELSQQQGHGDFDSQDPGAEAEGSDASGLDEYWSGKPPVKGSS